MSEFLSNGEVNSWNTPDAQSLQKRHFIEYLKSGIYSTYLNVMNRFYGDAPREQKYLSQQRELSTVANSEVPITVFIDEAAPWDDCQDIDTYFLLKIDPMCGKEIRDIEGNSMLFVGHIAKNGTIVELNPSFTTEQAQLVYKHGQELKQFGLEPELSQ